MIKKDIITKNFFLKFIPLIFLLFGLVLFFGKIFINNFHFFFADEADGTLHIYLLEHNYLFLRQQFPHLSLFNPPFFYPNTNVLFYTDPYITITPIYAFFRQFFNETTSFSSLLIFTVILNYFSLFFLLKNKLNLNFLASSTGAYLFTFSVFNYIQITHEHHTQLIYTFFIIISLYSILSIKKQNSVYKNIFWANMFYINIVLSVYNSFAITWYYCFALIIYFLSMLIFRKTRKRLIIFLKRFGLLLIINIVPSLIILTPLIYKYNQLGNFHWSYYSTPTLQEFFSNYSIYNYPFKEMNFTTIIEKDSGLEFLTLIIGLIGIWCCKTYRKALFACMLILFVLAIKINDFSLWEYIYRYFPGANGIRTNQRIIILFHFLISAGCAYFINTYISKNTNSIKKIIFISVISVLLCIGQIPYIQGYGFNYKDIYNAVNNQYMDVEKYSNLIKEKGCKIIYFDFTFPQEDIENWSIDTAYTTKAMWIAMKNNVYIINGYSGFKPEKYDRELTQKEKSSLCTFKIYYP